MAVAAEVAASAALLGVMRRAGWVPTGRTPCGRGPFPRRAAAEGRPGVRILRRGSKQTLQANACACTPFDEEEKE